MVRVYSKDAFPEMGYCVPHPAHSCWSCGHSEVTNAGANIPGLRCNLMAKMFKEAGISDGNPQVNAHFGSCKLHTTLMAQMHADAEVDMFPEDEAAESAGEENP